MRKTFKSIMFVAAAAMAFTACNVEQVETPEKTIGTHKVTFVASQAETKTTMEINNGIASFAWENTDKAYFHIFENGVGATGDDIGAELVNGIMNISAIFPVSSAPYTYTGFMAATVSNDNPAVCNEQIDLGAYDPESDILVAKPVTDKAPEDIVEGILFQFKRVVAINQMTLKGLTAGETVTEVTITSDKPIAGEYDFANGAWNASGTSISIDAEAVANTDGQAVVYFVSAPVEGVQLTVTATTAAGKTYSKKLAKTITFNEGGVKAFGVTVEESIPVPPAEPINLSIDFKTTAPTGWPTAKENAAEGTYEYSVDGKAYSFTHTKVGDGIYCGGKTPTSGYLMMVSGNMLGLPAIEGYALTKVVGTLNDSGTPSTSAKISITDGSSVVSGGAEQQWSTKGGSYTYTLSDTEANTVYYLSVSNKNLQMITLALTYEPSNGPTVTKYSVICEEVTGGTLSASPSKAEYEAVVTLTATPDEEYTFNNDWTVVDADENPVTVTDGQFTMPACNVSVSGSFTKKTYAITKNAAEHGTYSVKYEDDDSVTSASKGDKITLTASPADGYILNRWEVKDANDGNVSVSNNAFYMPASAVSISAYFVAEEAVPEYASLEDLVAADLTSGTTVKVSFENVPIKSIYVSGSYRNGIYFDIQKGGKDIEIFYRDVPNTWVVGGTVSGTMTCPWKNYNGTWELAPDQNSWNWNNLAYTAPLEPCADPVITISETGSATITCATADASIYYTVGTDPADPTDESTPYSGAVTMTDGQTIKAIAYRDGMKASAVVQETYAAGGGQGGTEKTFTIKSDDVVTNSSYSKYETKADNRNWIITFGGNNKSVGTNSSNRSKCTLSSYDKYAVGEVKITDIASAFACKDKLSGVKKISYTINGGSNQAYTKVYLLYSADGNSFSTIALSTGTQGGDISSGTEFTFDECSGYFALVFKATNSSGNWRIDDVDITFTYVE